MSMATGSTRSCSSSIHQCYFNGCLRRLKGGQIKTPEGLAIFSCARALKSERFIVMLDHRVLRLGNIVSQKRRLAGLFGVSSNMFEQGVLDLTSQDAATHQPSVDVPVFA